MDVHGPPGVVAEVPLRVDPQLLEHPTSGITRAGKVTVLPGLRASLQKAAGREGGDDHVGGAGRIEAPAGLHVPRVAPRPRPGSAVCVEQFEGAQAELAGPGRRGEAVRAETDRAEDTQRLRDQGVAATVHPAHVNRRASVQLDERLPTTTSSHQDPRPSPPQGIEGIRPAEVDARGGLRQREGRVDASAREGFTRPQRHHDRS